MFKEYLSGQRRKYYRPVALFILSTAFFLLIRSLLNFDPFDSVKADTTLVTDIEWLLAAGVFMSKNINNFMFLFVFTLGLLLKIFFSKRYSLAEFIAVSFYLVCVYALINGLYQFYLKLAGATPNFLPAGVFMTYLAYALWDFLKDGSQWIVFKSLIVFMLSFFLYLALSFAISVLVVLNA